MIFLHSSFRTSSTWVADCFRKLPGVTAFYEVFNEALSSIGRGQIYATTYDCWFSGHPAGAPYFLEFAPLITQSGGILNYDESMAFRKFIPEHGVQGEVSTEEKDYLAGLIAHAAKLGTFPVLSCTRTLGRLPGLKSALPGLHILIYRNLFRQWCSYTEQCVQGNPYFLNTIKRCIEHAGHDPFIRWLKETFPLEEPNVASYEYFCTFALLHIYLYGQAAASADLILDIEKAIDDREYRERISEEIRKETGLLVDLSGIKARIAFSFQDEDRRADLRESIRVLADLAVSQAPSLEGRGFAIKALSDFIQEWDRYSFYAGVLSTFSGPRGLLRDRQAVVAERDAVVKERDAAIRERDAMVAERDHLLADRGSMTTERDALLAERDAAAAARSAAMQERDAVAAERDALRVERDAVATGRNEARQAHDAAVAEREALRGERDQLAAARNAALEARDAVVEEREALRAARDYVTAARNAALQERDAVVAEREVLRAERDDVAAARNAALQERHAVTTERDTLRAERDELASARNMATEQRDVAMAERDTLRRERDELAQARRAAVAERDVTVADRDALRKERDALAAERDTLKATLDRLPIIGRILRLLHHPR
jgi:hypothetical protein